MTEHDWADRASGEVTFDLNEEPEARTAGAKAMRWVGTVCLRNSKELGVGRVIFYKSSEFFVVVVLLCSILFVFFTHLFRSWEWRGEGSIQANLP